MCWFWLVDWFAVVVVVLWVLAAWFVGCVSFWYLIVVRCGWFEVLRWFGAYLMLVYW